MSICNWWELQTLGSQPMIVPKNLPEHCSGGAIHLSNDHACMLLLFPAFGYSDYIAAFGAFWRLVAGFTTIPPWVAASATLSDGERGPFIYICISHHLTWKPWTSMWPGGCFCMLIRHRNRFWRPAISLPEVNWQQGFMWGRWEARLYATIPSFSFRSLLSKSLPKLCGPYVWSLSLTGPPLFECYMTSVLVMNGHPNDMCYDKIGQCV